MSLGKKWYFYSSYEQTFSKEHSCILLLYYSGTLV